MKKLIALLLLTSISFSAMAQKKLKKIPDILSEKHWAYIPKKVDLTKSTIGDTPTKIVESGDFYISKFEVTNHEYRRFLNSLEESDEKGHIPKSENWNEMIRVNKPNSNRMATEYYFAHNAFNRYPVVNVTLEDATAFAKWLTKEYNKQDKKEFKKVSFRLPTEDEWKVAALGETSELSLFPWGSPYIRNREGKALANMLRVSGSMIRNYWDEEGNQRVELIDKNLKENLSLTSQVASYNQTRHGLYDMAGNVAEMTTSVHPEVKEALVAKGGSYALSEYWAQVNSQYPFKGSNAYTGFRLVMEVIEE